MPSAKSKINTNGATGVQATKMSPRNEATQRCKRGKQVLAERMGTAEQVAKCGWGGGAHGCVME